MVRNDVLNIMEVLYRLSVLGTVGGNGPIVTVRPKCIIYRSQVALELSIVRIRPICKEIYIHTPHTYIHIRIHTEQYLEVHYIVSCHA
jgi:hypothetical protein